MMNLTKTLIGVMLLITPVIGIGGLYAQNTDQPGLEHIRVRFCNDDSIVGGTKTITLTGDANTDFELCLYVFNTYDKPLDIAINLVDGAITNDSMQNKACRDETTKEVVGQYATFSGDQTIFTLSGESVQQTQVSLQFPDYYAGKYYGCITAQIAQEEQTEVEGMFTFVNRLGYPFEIILDGDLNVDFVFQDFDQEPIENFPGYEIFGQGESVALIHKGLDQTVYAVAQNEGNIPQQVAISGTATLWEGYPWQTDLGLQSFDQEVISNNNMDIYLDLDDLPRYGGPVTLTISMSHKPILDFESDSITDTMRKPTTTTVHQTFRSFPPFVTYIPYIIGIVLLRLLVRWLLGSRKSHSSTEQVVTLTEDEYKALKKKAKKKKKKKKSKKHKKDSTGDKEYVDDVLKD